MNTGARALALWLGLSAGACSVVGYPSGAGSVPPIPAGSGTSDPQDVSLEPFRPPSEAADRGAPDFRRDRPPEIPAIDPLTVPDAVPVAEPRAAYGNMSEYEVSGRTYRTLDGSDGYVDEGTASWYGEEFHGRRTSSGEPYDMYAMSAAHRTLPLPTYLEVTNLDTGRSVVVRVNDRGPFHDDRLIDVSYAAAVRLGMIAAGTARVRIRAVGPQAR